MTYLLFPVWPGWSLCLWLHVSRTSEQLRGATNSKEAYGKWNNSITVSPVVEEINSGSPLPRIFGGTPTTRAKLAGVEVKCLVHTSSMVILVSENFFEEKLKPICSRAQGKGKMFTLLGANSFEIPYLGYLELDVQVEGVIVPDCRVLVLKDTEATVQYRKRMPSIVRMNVLVKILTWAELLKMKRAAATSWNCDHKSGQVEASEGCWQQCRLGPTTLSIKHWCDWFSLWHKCSSGTAQHPLKRGF